MVESLLATDPQANTATYRFRIGGILSDGTDEAGLVDVEKLGATLTIEAMAPLVPDGNAQGGKITFLPGRRVYRHWDADGFLLDARDGTRDIQVLATDRGDITEWTYKITLNVPGYNIRPKYFYAPAPAGQVTDLSDWVTEVSSKSNGQRATSAEAAARQAKIDAQTASQKATQAAASALAAQDSARTAQEAAQEAATSEVTRQLEAITTQANTATNQAQAAASSAQTAAETASEQATQAQSATTTASEARDIATQANTASQTAVTTANSALEAATNAQTATQNAQTAAQNAQTAATQAQTAAETASEQATQAANQANISSQKATQSAEHARSIDQAINATPLNVRQQQRDNVVVAQYQRGNEPWQDWFTIGAGATPNITLNTQKIDPGANPSVEKTGDIFNPVFTLGIPQGARGRTVRPVFETGTITTTGQEASISFTQVGEPSIIDEETVEVVYRVDGNLPKGERGETGHSPVVGMDGDQVTVDGQVVGGHLTGPTGPAPSLSVGTVSTGQPAVSVTPNGTGAYRLDFSLPEPPGDVEARLKRNHLLAIAGLVMG